ncbi:dihydroxyacetone phosphate acyltransferase [Bacillus rossius redtenbacheri]|uniref:dihydroxyacetone phosphate acyltransferase n=1 Tax=Bacillus rossius redtenbacheri TaxID=93214 RepID=UPI002FDD5D92
MGIEMMPSFQSDAPPPPSQNMSRFVDILEVRRHGSDFMFMSRKWEPMAAYRQSCKSSPTKLKQDVLSSSRVKHIVADMSREEGRSEREMLASVQAMLDEMALNRRTSVIRFLGLLLTKTLKRICSGLHVDHGSVARAKEVMGHSPVVFAPSHRSYGDFILMSYVCFTYDIQIPAIAAGMDFHSMWLMGQVLRDCCAFFMRRSFANDRLYWTAFSEYVYKLVTENESAIEFFIEGTRSRSAKSLMPKFGFLSLVLMPFFAGRVPDIVIVPVNISYDRTLEEKLFAYELLGVPKPKESTKGLLKATNILRERYGRVHVDFGAPVSVKEFCSGSVRRAAHRLVPAHVDRLRDEEAAACTALGHHVVALQRRHSVLAPFSLVAVLLGRHGPLPLPRLVEGVAWLAAVLRSLGAVVDLPDGDSVETRVKEAVEIHRSLVTITPENVLQLTKVVSPECTKDLSKVKGHNLSQETMDVAIPVVMLQHYINPTLHYLINLAFIAINVNYHSLHKDELYMKYHFLRVLLSYEFALYKDWELKEFETSMAQLEGLGIIGVSGHDVVRLDTDGKLHALLCHLLQPFLLGYLVVCRVLLEVAVTEPCGERAVLQSTQRRVEELLGSGALSHPYALCLEIHGNALQALVSLQALGKLRSNDHVQYLAYENKLNNVIVQLGGLVDECGEVGGMPHIPAKL